MYTREPFTLPWVDKKKKYDMHKMVALIKRIFKKPLSDQDDEITRIIDFIWQDGYSRGLKDMDKMHIKTNL